MMENYYQNHQYRPTWLWFRWTTWSLSNVWVKGKTKHPQSGSTSWRNQLLILKVLMGGRSQKLSWCTHCKEIFSTTSAGTGHLLQHEKGGEMTYGAQFGVGPVILIVSWVYWFWLPKISIFKNIFELILIKNLEECYESTRRGDNLKSDNDLKTDIINIFCNVPGLLFLISNI